MSSINPSTYDYELRSGQCNQRPSTINLADPYMHMYTYSYVYVRTYSQYVYGGKCKFYLLGWMS
jgi:hypothetical protein